MIGRIFNGAKLYPLGIVVGRMARVHELKELPTSTFFRFGTECMEPFDCGLFLAEWAWCYVNNFRFQTEHRNLVLPESRGVQKDVLDHVERTGLWNRAAEPHSRGGRRRLQFVPDQLAFEVVDAIEDSRVLQIRSDRFIVPDAESYSGKIRKPGKFPLRHIPEFNGVALERKLFTLAKGGKSTAGSLIRVVPWENIGLVRLHSQKSLPNLVKGAKEVAFGRLVSLDTLHGDWKREIEKGCQVVRFLGVLAFDGCLFGAGQIESWPRIRDRALKGMGVNFGRKGDRSGGLQRSHCGVGVRYGVYDKPSCG
jgi:hypothetical protein